MRNTGVNGMRVIHRVELEDWSSRASRHWSPIMTAGRQFNWLLEAEDVPGMAAYDVLYDLTNVALRWLEENPCPDRAVGIQFEAQMKGYRAVVDTVRSAITEEDGDAMVAQLRHLRDVIDEYSDATGIAPPQADQVPEKAAAEKGSIVPFRRRVPRQPAGWDGLCHIEGELANHWRECRVIDISMLGLGISFKHSSPSALVGCRISVDVPAIGDSVSIRLEGEITNATPTFQGRIARVGIELDEPSDSEPGAATVERTLSGHDGSELAR
jgi:PilZ domain